MFTSSLQNGLIFTVHTIFSVYIMIVLFRFLLQLTRAGFNYPLAQFSIKATNPLLRPLRKIIPGFKKIDFASPVLILLLQCAQLYIIMLIRGDRIGASYMSILGLALWAIGEILDLFLVFLFFITLLQVIFSWIQPGNYHSGQALLSNITRPIFRPIRKFLPNFGGLDITPMVVVFLILLIRMVVVTPLIYYARGLA